MKDMLQKLGYRTMSYQELSSIDDALKFAEKHDGFPFIVLSLVLLNKAVRDVVH